MFCLDLRDLRNPIWRIPLIADYYALSVDNQSLIPLAELKLPMHKNPHCNTSESLYDITAADYRKFRTASSGRSPRLLRPANPPLGIRPCISWKLWIDNM